MKIKDIFHASALKAKGLKIKDVEWSNGVAYWVFDDPDNSADYIIRQYMNNELVGSISNYAEAYKTLKGMLFSK